MNQLTLFAPPTVKPKPSLKSCSLIYTPKGRAREYAALACNVYRGCDHLCEYCFAPSATRRERADFQAVTTRGPDFLRNLEREAATYQAHGVGGQVLLSFTCDPYCRLDVTEQIARRAIKILHAYGLNVQILTKGGSRALRDLDLFGPGDAFASTLTLTDPARSLEWEPGAASPADRIATLRAFHQEGIPTWVSLEPVIDPAEALQIIWDTHGFVDLYKVGKLNYHPLAKTIDWQHFAREAIALLKNLCYSPIEADESARCNRHNRGYYIKSDLMALLE